MSTVAGNPDRAFVAYDIERPFKRSAWPRSNEGARAALERKVAVDAVVVVATSSVIAF